jgi:hypothetical protein
MMTDKKHAGSPETAQAISDDDDCKLWPPN